MVILLPKSHCKLATPFWRKEDHNPKLGSPSSWPVATSSSRLGHVVHPDPDLPPPAGTANRPNVERRERSCHRHARVQRRERSPPLTGHLMPVVAVSCDPSNCQLASNNASSPPPNRPSPPTTAPLPRPYYHRRPYLPPPPRSRRAFSGAHRPPHARCHRVLPPHHLPARVQRREFTTTNCPSPPASSRPTT